MPAVIRPRLPWSICILILGQDQKIPYPRQHLPGLPRADSGINSPTKPSMTINKNGQFLPRQRQIPIPTGITYIENGKCETKHRSNMGVEMVSLRIGLRHASREAARTIARNGASALPCDPSGPTAHRRRYVPSLWRVCSVDGRLKRDDLSQKEKLGGNGHNKEPRPSMTTGFSNVTFRPTLLHAFPINAGSSPCVTQVR